MLAPRPGNKGRRYPADPPRVEEIVAVMKQAGDGEFGRRLRGIIVVLWRGGLRISEAPTLTEGDLEIARGAIVVRRGKGGRRREVGMDDRGWEQLRPWLEARVSLPIGPLFCVISGPTRGRPLSSSQVRTTLHETALKAGIRRRFAPHQLRHAHAVEMAREGVPINLIQRQLGHASLGVTSIYLQGIDTGEIIESPDAPSAGDSGSSGVSGLVLFVQSSSSSGSSRDCLGAWVNARREASFILSSPE